MSPMGIHQKPLQTICKENSIDGSHIANNTNNINKVHREIKLQKQFNYVTMSIPKVLSINLTYKRFLSKRHFL